MLKKHPTPKNPSRETATTVPDLSALAPIVDGMLARQQEYDRAIGLLRAARREQREAAEIPLPDLSLDVERELLVLAGDADALAAFDAEHGPALAAARKAAEDASERAARLPARIAALEVQVKRIAQRMIEETDESALRDEAEQLFAPYAERVAQTADAYAQALRQARAVSDALYASLRITEHDVYGYYCNARHIELLGRLDNGDIVPTHVAGVPYETLRDLNDSARADDPALSEAMHAALTALGITRGLRLYRPGNLNDARPVYAGDDVPKAKRSDVGPLPGHEFVRDHPVNASLCAK